MIQFSLISLIPGLIRNLQDCASVDLNSHEDSLATPSSCKTSDRSSLLAFMGVPLQIFGKGSLFGPYTPLQQLDVLADHGTKSYLVGSTNSLLLTGKDRYSDILIHLDDLTISITSPSLRSALALTVADRRWIDFITQSVSETWDETNPSRPKTHGYVGSEEFIRLQFEEYLLSLLSSVKCHNYLQRHKDNPRMTLPQVDGDPAHDFGTDFLHAWQNTENYRLWNSHTDSSLFDIVEPKHPCAGGLTIDDVRQRVSQQVQELHLDERFEATKEVLGRNIASGKEGVNKLFNKLYADMETLRENQRRRAEDNARLQAEREKNGEASPSFAPDLSKAQAAVQSVGSKAGSYVSGWGTWIGDKRKNGWGRSTSSGNSGTSNAEKTAAKESGLKPLRMSAVLSSPPGSPRNARDRESVIGPISPREERPQTAESYVEDIFDAEKDGSGSKRSSTSKPQITLPVRDRGPKIEKKDDVRAEAIEDEPTALHKQDLDGKSA